MEKVLNYRSYNIFRNPLPIECNIANDKNEIVNKITPYYSYWVESKKRYATGSCYAPIETDFKYLKKHIDNIILRRTEKAAELFEIRNGSRFYTYICNNVVIKVLVYGDNQDIFVNDRPLRNVCLTENFTFNDVLMNVYFNKIANYNIAFWNKGWREGLKYNNYINHKTVKVDLDILPIYEYLNTNIEISGCNVFVMEVRQSGNGFLINGKYFVEVENVKDIKILEMNCNQWESIVALRNKTYFYE